MILCTAIKNMSRIIFKKKILIMVILNYFKL
jgi:hypothetical protein